MQITTRFVGHPDPGEAPIITFPQGLPGEGYAKRFRLIPEEQRDTVWQLQAMDGTGTSLSVILPAVFGFGYDLAISPSEESVLGLVEPEDALVVVVLRSADAQGAEPLPGYPRLSGDLHRPLIINLRRCIGMQKHVPRLRQSILLRALE